MEETAGAARDITVHVELKLGLWNAIVQAKGHQASPGKGYNA